MNTEIQMVRDIILDTNEKIEEDIKWSSPTFMYKGNIASYYMNLIKKHNDTTPKEYLISLWFQFAYIYFLKKDFKSSLHWINEIMNSSFASIRPDLHVQTHFLNLMVHLELKNFFVMRYFVDSTKRFGKKNQSFKPHHRILLNFFTKVSGARSRSTERYSKSFMKKLLPVI